MEIGEPKVELMRLGREGEPLVIIDNFSGHLERLRSMGMAAQDQEAPADYPGIRALADPSYLDLRRDLMMQIVGRVFGCSRSINCEVCAFSLVTVAEQDLTPRQCVPHHDHSDAGWIAIMHYLDGPESGGTAFYRHKRTGFEAITPDRAAAYDDAVAQDERDFGPPPRRYPYGDDQRYEMIEEVEAQPDRLILYRGRQLHSGVIPDPAALSSDPGKGRLTVNMFLFGN